MKCISLPNGDTVDEAGTEAKAKTELKSCKLHHRHQHQLQQLKLHKISYVSLEIVIDIEIAYTPPKAHPSLLH